MSIHVQLPNVEAENQKWPTWLKRSEGEVSICQGLPNMYMSVSLGKMSEAAFSKIAHFLTDIMNEENQMPVDPSRK